MNRLEKRIEQPRHVGRKIKAGFFCWDCKEHFSYEDDYQVHDGVWAETGVPPRHPERFVVLHLRCLAARLGRPLRRRDFVWCPMNLDYNTKDLKQHILDVVESKEIP